MCMRIMDIINLLVDKSLKKELKWNEDVDEFTQVINDFNLSDNNDFEARRAYYYLDKRYNIVVSREVLQHETEITCFYIFNKDGEMLLNYEEDNLPPGNQLRLLIDIIEGYNMKEQETLDELFSSLKKI